MKKRERFDVYDILLELLGYGNPDHAVPEEFIERYREKAMELAAETGLVPGKKECWLVLWYDTRKTDEDELYVTLLLAGIDDGKIPDYLSELQQEGKAYLKKGSYCELRPLLDELRRKKLRVTIEPRLLCREKLRNGK